MACNFFPTVSLFHTCRFPVHPQSRAGERLRQGPAQAGGQAGEGLQRQPRHRAPGLAGGGPGDGH